MRILGVNLPDVAHKVGQVDLLVAGWRFVALFNIVLIRKLFIMIALLVVFLGVV